MWPNVGHVLTTAPGVLPVVHVGGGGGSFGHLFCARLCSDDETLTESLNARIGDEIAPRFCLPPTCCRDSRGLLS